MSLEQQLLNPSVYPHACETVECVETHSAWVFLTGDIAYKVKKPVDFGFLDFSSLEKRKFFCEEEIRLNTRSAPDIYLDVVAITHDGDSLCVGGSGEIIEYAVKMQQFDRSQTLDLLCATQQLSAIQAEAIGIQLANFHAGLDGLQRTDLQPVPSSAAAMRHTVEQNFQQIENFAIAPAEQAKVTWLRTWFEQQVDSLEAVFEERLAEGFVKECHGDLHLGNILLNPADSDQVVTFFDCIDFNPYFRTIDVMAELGFLLMDVEARGMPEQANTIMNHYFNWREDFAGIALLHFYIAHYAIVRAKVSLLISGGGDDLLQHPMYGDFCKYVNLASSYCQRPQPVLAITCGVSGSGKSTRAADWAQQHTALWVRSDIERKRLANLPPDGNSNAGIYSKGDTERTYQRLYELANNALSLGLSCIVDATFLRAEQRQSFLELAQQQQASMQILACNASPETLRTRLEQRQTAGNDASEANWPVAEAQLAAFEALRPEERALLA